jgi:hypothetical protein
MDLLELWACDKPELTKTPAQMIQSLNAYSSPKKIFQHPDICPVATRYSQREDSQAADTCDEPANSNHLSRSAV